MTTLTEELALLLDEYGVGTYRPEEAGGTLFLHALPDAPDVALAIAPYGSPGEADSRNPWTEASVQLRARSTRADARPGEVLCQAAHDALHGAGMRHMPGGTWLQLAVGLQSGPQYIGRDQGGRHEFTCNVRVEYRHPTVHRP